MKLLESSESNVTKDENVENALCLEINELMLVHCNILNNNHRQNSVLYTFLPSKYFVQLIDISPKSFIF